MAAELSVEREQEEALRLHESGLELLAAVTLIRTRRASFEWKAFLLAGGGMCRQASMAAIRRSFEQKPEFTLLRLTGVRHWKLRAETAYCTSGAVEHRTGPDWRTGLDWWTFNRSSHHFSPSDRAGVSSKTF